MTRALSIAASAFLLFASAAQALTITNKDSEEHRLQVTEGDEEPVSHEVSLPSGQTLEDLCPEGCVIALQNGVQESFEGGEAVDIKDGRFEITE